MDAPASTSRIDRPALVLVAILAVTLALTWGVAGETYFSTGDFLAVHGVLETASVAVAVLIFGVGWASYRRETPGSVIVLAVSFLAVGALDFLHMMSYTGMPAFVSPSHPEKSIFFWLMPRYVDVVTLAIVALAPWRPFARPASRYAVLLAYAAFTAFVAWIGLTHQAWLPHTFVEGVGLTPLKIAMEWVSIAVYAFIAWRLWRHPRPGMPATMVRNLSAAAVTMAFAGLALTLYTTFSSSYALLGHLYKVTAYYFLYRGLFVTGVQEPYRRLDEANRQLKAQADTLAEADRYKDEFLAVISHELRTPLNFIMGFASVLDDEVQGPLTAPQHQSVQRILAGSEQMLGLVNDLLDYARLQAGELSVSRAPTSYAEVVDGVLASLAPLAERKGLALKARVTAPGPMPIDGVRIAQVLANLVGNAIKFTETGAVVLEAHAEGDWLVTTVADTGPGIAEHDRGRIFERFQQVDMSKTRHVGGVGLGLAIAKALVEAHGGDIALASQLGVGTTVTFRLPLVAPGPAD